MCDCLPGIRASASSVQPLLLPTTVSAFAQLRHRIEAREPRRRLAELVDPHTEAGKAFCANGGQRIATVLVYLNDVVEGGGETYFK